MDSGMALQIRRFLGEVTEAVDTMRYSPMP